MHAHEIVKGTTVHKRENGKKLRNESEKCPRCLHLMEVCLKQQSKYNNSQNTTTIKIPQQEINDTLLSSIELLSNNLYSKAIDPRPDKVLGEILRSEIVELLRHELNKLPGVALALQNLSRDISFIQTS